MHDEYVIGRKPRVCGSIYRSTLGPSIHRAGPLFFQSEARTNLHLCDSLTWIDYFLLFSPKQHRRYEKSFHKQPGETDRASPPNCMHGFST